MVEEQLAYELSGEGEHLWLWVEKTNQNSDWVAKQIAHFIGIPARAVGVAGKKDRYAVTRQWMSCHLPGKTDPDFSTFQVDGVRILNSRRHQRKLQTGGLSGNRFEIVLRDLSGDLDSIESRLMQIKTEGVPNYFGEQRFGRNFDNLSQASRFFSGELRPKRHQKTMYLSAARSWIFNQILSHRIELGNWNQFEPGDVLQLEGSQRWFKDDGDDGLAQRVLEKDLHPTGALVGRGELPSTQQVADLEAGIIGQHPLWQQGLEKAGMQQDRRALRVVPQQLSWHLGADNVMRLEFVLPAGSYATMLVRELMLPV